MLLLNFILTRGAFAVMIFMSLLSFSRAEDLPRLFLVERGNSAAFFLPITHLASAVEINDRYLDQIIRPAYDSSTELLDETAAIGPENFFVSCDAHEISDASIDPALDNEFSLAVAGSYWDSFDPLMRANVGRFMKFLMVFLPPEKQHANPQDLYTSPPVQAILFQQEKKPHSSIESVSDMFNAYCSLSVSERELLIRYAISISRTPETSQIELMRKKIPKMLSSQYLEELQKAVVTLNSVSPPQSSISQRVLLAPAVDEKAAYGKYALALRNKNWMNTINKISEQPGTAFYALGAAHFADGPNRQGLISLLRENGYRVSLIKSPDQIKKILQNIKEKARPLIK